MTAPGVADVPTERFAELGIPCHDLVGARKRAVEILGHGAPAFEIRIELAAQPVGVEQVAHPNAAPRDFVFVAGADPSLRRSDRAVRLLLAELVDQLVVGQHDVRALTHEKPALRPDTALTQGLDFFQEHAGIDDRALADDALGLLMKDPGRDQMKNLLLAADHQGVARVCTTGISNDEVGVWGVQVDDLAFALVPPLGSYHYQCAHDSFPTRVQADNSSKSASLGSLLSARARPSRTRVSRPLRPSCQINRS